MNTTDNKKIETNTTSVTNQRLVTILLVLLIALVALLVIGIVLGFFMGGSMMGGMMNWEMMSHMMGMNGQTINAMTSACAEMMRHYQSP